MILRAAGHGGVVNPLNFGDERRKLPPWLIGAIGASIALHVAGAIFVYNQRFVLPVEEPTNDPFVITLERPPTPPVITEDTPKPPTTVVVRPAQNVADNVERAPITASPPDAIPGEGKPVISDVVTPVEETGQAEILTPAVIRRPDWVSKPTASQMERVYPRRALEDGISGRVVLRCAVTVAGALTGCSVASETPSGAGFGDAAMKLTRHFRMSPKMVDGRPIEGALVSIPLTFSTGG